MQPLLPPSLPAPGAPPTSPADPLTPEPLRSHLFLNEAQLKALCDRAHTRICELRKDMGLSVIALGRGNSSALTLSGSLWGSGLISQQNSWAWKREIAQRQYDNDFEYRKALYGGVFEESNWSPNYPKHWAQMIAAQISDDLLGSEPFFAAMPQNPGNPELAKQVEAYLQKEIAKSNLRETLKEAEKVALIRNDATVKVTWVRRATTYRGPARVLVNVSAFPLPLPDGRLILPGEPVRLAGGLLVYERDDVVELPGAEPENPDAAPGPTLLKKDPTFFMPPPDIAQFIDFDEIEQLSIDYEGLEASIVYFRDFLFPVRAPSLEASDMLVHVLDESLDDVRARFGDFEGFDQYDRYCQSAEATRARPEHGEQDFGSRVLQQVNEHECYMLCPDPAGGGKQVWVYLIYDFNAQKAIFWDYLKNHMAGPPFVMIPGVERVENRAFGVGVFEMARDRSLFIDLTVNRVNIKASKTGDVNLVRMSAIQQVKDGMELLVGTGKFYTWIEDGNSNPPVLRINLAADIPPEAMKLMEQFIQSGQLEFGTISAADGTSSNLNASDTKYGIQSIENSGNALRNSTTHMHARCFEKILGMAADIILENMPESVLLSEGGDQLATLNREEIRNLPRDVRLTLSKSRSAQALEYNAQATKMVTEYYGLPKVLQKKVRSLYIASLRRLDVQDADEILDDPSPEDIAAEQQAQAAGQEKPPSTSVSAKLGDFVGSERPQIVQKFYEIQPASPEEVAIAAAANLQQQQVPLPEHHPRVLPAPGASSAA